MAILNQIKGIVCSHYIHENVNKRFSLQMLGLSTSRKEGGKVKLKGKEKKEKERLRSRNIRYDKGEEKKKKIPPSNC